MASIGNLYSKCILVRLTNSKSEDRFKSIQITVDYQTSIQPTHKTELIIKLTDQQDPFFLYSLYMSEEDYQTLKVQQGLLVDFGAFGQRFIDLLCACEKDEKSENPKFQLQFYSKEPLPFDHGHASLNVIEINPFKHLYHLSLNFMPGNDADVKKYLATCLQMLREDYNKLNKVYEETRSSLSQKLDNTQQTLVQKNMDYEKLRIELDSQSERILTKHMQELNFERDKSMQNQYASQQKWEKEKKELELNQLKATKLIESRLNELELSNKELLERKYKNESQLQELRLKNSSLLEEYTAVKQDLSSLRKQNTSMDSELHANEKLLNQLRTRIAVLEQELKDKVDSSNKSHEQLTGEQEQRKQLEELVKEKQAELKKKQAEINHYVQEFKKGNEVVIKLQTREKSLVGQLKLKTRILNEQEKVMKEKEKEIDDLKAELKEAKIQLADMNTENKELKATLQKKTVELDEAAKLLKRDENIISWLNKQITDNNIASNGKLVSYESNNTGGMFKPFGALISNTSNTGGIMSNSPLSNASNTSNQMDSMLHTNSYGMLRSAPTLNQNSYLNTKSTIGASQMQMYTNGNYQQQQQRALSSASNSSLQHTDTLKENQESEQQTFRGLNGSNGSTKLDPKYFQSHQADVPKPQPVKPSSSIRINKQLVQSGGSNTQQLLQNGGGSSGANSLMPNQAMPSLASAYFPSS